MTPFETTLSEGSLEVVFTADAEGRPSWRVAGGQACPVGPVELLVAGRGNADHHGSKHTGGQPGRSLVHHRFEVVSSPGGRTACWKLEAPGLSVTALWRFFSGIPAVRVWVEVTNTGDEPLVLETVASLALGGMTGGVPWDTPGSRIHIGHNTWYGEAQWTSHSLAELGLHRVNRFSMKRISAGQSGTWPCSEQLPMGLWERPAGGTWGWQIEHQGSWHWEISDREGELYLLLTGPDHQEHGWAHCLRPGETFTSVPAALAFTPGGPDETIGALTSYRRAIRRPHGDMVRLPVIFNDYMNCLMGDPTTEKLLPLIDAAAEMGCEVFCIDAGWYADGDWFDGVGEWLPSRLRFPRGIEEPLARIRDRGMVSGLWLEIEVMGVRCPLASQVPEEWFFRRNGQRVVDNGRHFLDFRNPEVRSHADQIVDRLVVKYGVGYIKMDYNNNAGPGTDHHALTPADGLLGHQRAYLEWLEAVMDRYPGLVVENCGSGGLRMEYALLSRHPLQSVSDQTDYRLMAAIAAASPSAVTPEQAAVWSYPLRNADNEAVVFNMVNALLLRVHQSGHLAELGPAARKLVAEGLEAYKTWRTRIPGMLPFWPLGWPSFGDRVVCLGLRDSSGFLLAVWRTDPTGVDSSEVEVPLDPWAEDTLEVVYPSFARVERGLGRTSGGCLTVDLPAGFAARIIRGTFEKPSATSGH